MVSFNKESLFERQEKDVVGFTKDELEQKEYKLKKKQ